MARNKQSLQALEQQAAAERAAHAQAGDEYTTQMEALQAQHDALLQEHGAKHEEQLGTVNEEMAALRAAQPARPHEWLRAGCTAPAAALALVLSRRP